MNVDMNLVSKAATAQVAEANQCLAHIQKMEITTTPELRFTTSITAEVKEKYVTVDTQRRRFTESAQAVIDEANAFFKPALVSLKECEVVLKRKIAEYDSRLSDKRRKLIAQAGTAGAGGDATSAEFLMKEADTCIIPKVPGLSMRRSVSLDIHDTNAALAWCIQHDRLELLKLNDKAIKDLAKASADRGIDIPGVTVTHSTSPAITAAKVERG